MQESKQESLSVQNTQICQICYVTYNSDLSECARPAGICYNCWYLHVKTAIEKISYKVGSSIISPFQGKEPIDVGIALNTLSADHHKQLQYWLFKKYTAFTTDIQKCPSQICDYVFMIDKCKWGTQQNLNCPKCEASLTHADQFSIKSVIGFIYFIFLTNKCPKCEIPIEKTTGCPHMSCPCGHQFCWYCLKDYYATPYNIYSIHEPKQCAFIFFSKIAFFIICLAGVVLTSFGNDFFQEVMGIIFLGLRYFFHALILDLFIIGNFTIINQYMTRYNQHHFGIHPQPTYLLIGAVVLDILFIGVLYWLQILTLTGIVLIFELLVVAVGAGLIYSVIYSVETWFDFIC